MTKAANSDIAKPDSTNLMRTIRQIVRDELRAVADGVSEVRQLLALTTVFDEKAAEDSNTEKSTGKSRTSTGRASS